MKRTFTRQRITRAAMTLLVTMLTATTAWAGNVNLSVDDAIAEGTAGHWYVNMPTAGANTLTLTENDITAGKGTFKVYDGGGKSGDYGSNDSGALVLTAPAGYVLRLSGSITTQSNYDKLTVNDGNASTAPKLLDAVCSTSDGTQTAITTVASSGQSMRLEFNSNSSKNYAGLDLTVTLVSTSTEYDITVNTTTGGTVAADKSKAKVNDVVTLTATPSDGYMLSSISVTDAYSNAVAVTGGWYTNNQVTFTMPLSVVTVTPTFTNDLTSLSINMPATGTKTATIPSGVTSFKVYDDGGASGYYSNSCDGTLTLTAPAGYVLQLSGSITTENGGDKLTVYDGSTTSSTKLLDAVSSTSNDSQTAITTVISSGQSMTLYFSSDINYNYAGLDLTVTLVSTSTDYVITINNATGGSVTATVNSTNATTAKVNDVVTLTATPDNGYLLSDLSVKDADNNDVAVTDMRWYTGASSATFTMPASNVTVTPTFTNDLTSLSVNMPKTGTKQATIPSDVTSFKVYDDGGASGKYSNSCDGTLVLTAPTGHVLQLSGIITTERFDRLTVYDGSEASGTKLLDAVSSTSDGTQTAITTVTSSGQSMTLYFYSGSSFNYAGLDLTVTLVDPNAQYNINGLGATTGGSVTASVGGQAASTAKVNETVTLTATPTDATYLLSDLTVVDANSNAVAVTDMLWYTNANTATFTMPGSAVTVTPTFTNTWTAAGGLYINMPATDTKSVTIPAGVQSFKVYDDGGASGNYGNSCSGTLTLTAPAGYVLQLSGNIRTQNRWDNLTVYDGSSNSATKLLDAVSSTNSGTQTAITTVISSGQSMTLYFNSDASSNYAGLDLTVTLVDPNAQYNIKGLGATTGGSVAATVSNASATKAKLNDVVTLAATPESGYVLSGISVTDASTNPVAVTWDGMFSNTATFTMPGTAVTVTPTFTNDLANIYINMPWTDMQTVAIPSNVTSLKVYDDGGASGNYSNNCRGTLVLTAPAGYVLQLSGSIKTDTSDNLTVYDNGEANGTKLLDAVSSTSSNTQTAITTVTSSGQSMTLYFYSDTGTNYAGLDLTVTIVPIPWSGSGNDADDPFIIEYPSQLNLLAQRVNDGNSYSGKYFKLGADITYDHNTDWDNASSTENNYKPIGGYFGSGKDRYFKGHFDGANHVISGIRIYRSGTADPDTYQGLFGQINGNTAEVKNIILADARITGHSFSGGIVGNLYGGTVENCHVLDDVTINAVQNSTSNIGGIAGCNRKTVTGCTSAATLTIADGLSSCLNYGGIVGYNLGTVKDCLYLGTTIPSGANSVGAIVGGNDGSTVTNCYYTDTDIKGKNYYASTLANDKCAVGNGSKTNCGLAHTITLSNGATLGGTATAHGSLTAYGDFALAYNDGTSTTIYSTAGNTVTLGDAPEGGIFGGYTATNGGTIIGNDTDGYTLTMPAADVTVTALLSFTYIDENGVEQTHAATIIDGSQTNLPGGWYVVNSNVNLTTKLNFTGDTHLILADGKTLSIDASGDSDYLGLSCRDGSTSYELTIYGQAAGTGKVTSKHGHPGYGAACGYNAKTITINGGVVEATSSGRGICGSNVIINGGQIILAPSYANITADNITLGWRKPSDYIQSSEFINPSGMGTITITDGKVFTDGTGIYDHTTTTSTLEHLSNVTLRPCLVLTDNASNADAIAEYNGKTIAVALSDRTLLKNGDWNTLCLPFSLTAEQIAASPLAGATIMELLSTSNLNSEGKLTLNFQDVTAIMAGKPYIVKWDPTDNLTNPVFNNVTIDNTMNDVSFPGGSFKGTYAPLEITNANRNEVLLLATGNRLGYAKTDRTVANGKALGTCRAYFEITGAATVRSFIMDFGDEQTTGITTTNAEPSTNEGIGWYDLSGRRLQGKPTEKGVYIQNGKKTIIK